MMIYPVKGKLPQNRVYHTLTTDTSSELLCLFLFKKDKL